MKRAILSLLPSLLPSLLLLAIPARADAPLVHASASCTPSDKPGRIRCRAVLELPLDRVATTKLTWSELRVVSSDAAITPLRGRLGPLDAETRDDARVVWSFSIAAEASGSMRVRLLATIEPKSAPPTLVDQSLEVAVRIAP